MKSVCWSVRVVQRRNERRKGSTHDGVDVGETVRVEQLLDVLPQESLVRAEQVEHVRERVFGLAERSVSKAAPAKDGHGAPCQFGSYHGRRQTASGSGGGAGARAA